jgi:flagellar hook-associated protein 1
MATLSSALNYALAGLSVTATQSALVSRNVSFAGDENYTRKSAEILTLPGGAPVISNYTRSMDKQLFDKMLGAGSSAAGREVVIDVLSRLGQTVGDPQDDASLAAIIGKLQDDLRTYESNPASSALAASAVNAARDVVNKLNEVSSEILDVRSQADAAMAQSVARIGTLLAQFKIANDTVVRGSGTATELTDSLDQRDSILKLLSEELGIRTATRPNNDVLIYAEGGAVLFEGSPRSITFSATLGYSPDTIGNQVIIDGVPVTGPLAPMPVSGGKLPALAAVRDKLSLTLQNQVDEIAAGLIRGFAESDQSAIPVLPKVAGLFLDTSGGIPIEGALSTGLASRLRLNPLADPEVGGSPFLVRDGGFGGGAYVYNVQNSAAYQGRIRDLIRAIDTPSAFDPQAGLDTTATLKAFGAKSASWVEAQRQTAQSAYDAANATRVRAGQTLLRVTGVNIDQEMAALLDLEKSYQASSKVISVVDAMLSSLLEAVR